MRIVNPKRIRQKARSHRIHPTVQPGLYRVESGESGNAYWVLLDTVEASGICTCPWGKHHFPSGCSHVVAALAERAEAKGRRISAWSTVEEAKRQHQPWREVADGMVVTSRKAA
jgi:uncharacterized Zn finger protein